MRGRIKGAYGDEAVSDINGLVVPTIWEYNRDKRSTLWIEIENIKEEEKRPSFLVKNYMEKMNFPCKTT